MERKTLLAAYAHPDDESFGVGGVFNKYHHEGVFTALICATRGEAGEISDPALATPETLGQVREGELRVAAQIMGTDEVIFLDYHDGRLAQADEHEAVGKIVYHLRRLRPQVVVTFDPSGVYGHPDHIAIHRLTVAAFHQAGDPERYPEQLRDGLQAYAPQKLYYGASPVSTMRQMLAVAAAAGTPFTPGGNAATIPVEQMGTPDDQITTEVRLTDDQLAAKRAALNAHRTQIGPDSIVNRLTPEQMRDWRGTEYFVLAYPEGERRVEREHDLFSGVTV